MVQIKEVTGYALAAAIIGGVCGPAFVKDEGSAARGLGAATCSKFIKDSLDTKDASFAYFSAG